MDSFFDNNNLTTHSFEDNATKITQEGTRMSPPVTVHPISINGVKDNYVTLSDHERIVAEILKENERLNRELAGNINNMVTKEFMQRLFMSMNQHPSQNEPTETSDKSSYHDVHFDNNIDVSTLTQELIALSVKKKGMDKEVWIINSLKSWGIVCKILKDKNIFIGNNTDFCKYLLEEVFPNIKDVKRKNTLMKLKPSNMTHLSAEIRDKKIFEWNIEYKNNPNLKTYKEGLIILNEINRIIPKIKKNR